MSASKPGCFHKIVSEDFKTYQINFSKLLANKSTSFIKITIFWYTLQWAQNIGVS